jgi:hypothetical protein
MPGEQHLHGELVASGNPLNPHFIGGAFTYRDRRKRGSGGSRLGQCEHAIFPLQSRPDQTRWQGATVHFYFVRRLEPFAQFHRLTMPSGTTSNSP